MKTTWTADVLDLLAELYPDTPDAELCAALSALRGLPTSMHQIRLHAYALGVHRSPEFVAAKGLVNHGARPEDPKFLALAIKSLDRPRTPPTEQVRPAAGRHPTKGFSMLGGTVLPT